MGTYAVMFEAKPGDPGLQELTAHLTILGGIEVLQNLWIMPPNRVQLTARELIMIAASNLDDSARIFVSDLGEDRMGRNLPAMGPLFW